MALSWRCPEPYNLSVASRLRWSRRPLSGPRWYSAVLVAASVAGLGLVVLAFQPRLLRLAPRELAPKAVDILPVDVLGVAQHDYVYSFGPHLILARLIDGDARTVWQVNFARDVQLSAAADITGDGLDEITVALHDSTLAEALVLDAGADTTLRLGPLSGRSTRPGLPWDGLIVAAAPLLSNGQRKLVAVVAVGYSRAPRGIALYDVKSGARDWFYPMGAYPGRPVVADIDRNGEPEIVVTTTSPGNGGVANDTDDEHCYVFALDAFGRRLWQVQLGGAFAYSYAAVLPPQEDGHARIAAALDSYRARLPEPARLLLLDGPTGRVLARGEYPSGFGQLQVVDEKGCFVVGSRDGSLRLFSPGLRLLTERRFDPGISAWAVADLDEDGRSEVVASTPREALVLGDDLRVRARFALREGLQTPPPVRVGRAGLGHRRLAVADGRALLADVVAVPPLADPSRLAVVLALALIAGMTSFHWHRLARWRLLPAGAAAREFLVDFLQIRHETFGRERPFARVRLWLQAHAAGQSPPSEMFESACEEFERIGLPTLLRYAERARALRVDRAEVHRVRDLARAAADSLRDARAARPEKRPALLEGTLALIGELSEACAGVYWEVVMRQPCRPDQVAQEALLAKRPALEAAGVATRFHAEAGVSAPVLFDRDELRALVGELLENSARALHGMPGAEVTVSISVPAPDPRWVMLRVSDNGPGLAPERREAAFAPENASRPDGGFGLFHAREVARRWLGELTLESPETGHGAVLRLMLRSCRIEVARSRRGAPTGGRDG